MPGEEKGQAHGFPETRTPTSRDGDRGDGDESGEDEEDLDVGGEGGDQDERQQGDTATMPPLSPEEEEEEEGVPVRDGGEWVPVFLCVAGPTKKMNFTPTSVLRIFHSPPRL